MGTERELQRVDEAIICPKLGSKDNQLLLVDPSNGNPVLASAQQSCRDFAVLYLTRKWCHRPWSHSHEAPARQIRP